MHTHICNIHIHTACTYIHNQTLSGGIFTSMCPCSCQHFLPPDSQPQRLLLLPFPHPVVGTAPPPSPLLSPLLTAGICRAQCAWLREVRSRMLGFFYLSKNRNSGDVSNPLITWQPELSFSIAGSIPASIQLWTWNMVRVHSPYPQTAKGSSFCRLLSYLNLVWLCMASPARCVIYLQRAVHEKTTSLIVHHGSSQRSTSAVSSIDISFSSITESLYCSKELSWTKSLQEPQHCTHDPLQRNFIKTESMHC